MFEKLVRLLSDKACHKHCVECVHRYDADACLKHQVESMARHLILNGVTVPADPKPLEDYDGALYNADPNCEHNVVPVPSGGVKCTKCGGWFAY